MPPAVSRLLKTGEADAERPDGPPLKGAARPVRPLKKPWFWKEPHFLRPLDARNAHEKCCCIRLWGSAPNPGRGMIPLHPALYQQPDGPPLKGAAHPVSFPGSSHRTAAFSALHQHHGYHHRDRHHVGRHGGQVAGHVLLHAQAQRLDEAEQQRRQNTFGGLPRPKMTQANATYPREALMFSENMVR